MNMQSLEMPQDAAPTVGGALRELARDPWRRVLLRFNGKAALLSAIVRGAIFAVASIKSHHAGRGSAVLAEAVFGASCAGLFGTVTQAVRFATPRWQSELIVAVAIPLTFQAGNFFFHAALGDGAFRAGMISSAVFTCLSALFNLFIMRRGTLLAGAEGRSFLHDLATLPRLALLFVFAGLKNAARLVTLPLKLLRQPGAAAETLPNDSL